MPNNMINTRLFQRREKLNEEAEVVAIAGETLEAYDLVTNINGKVYKTNNEIHLSNCQIGYIDQSCVPGETIILKQLFDVRRPEYSLTIKAFDNSRETSHPLSGFEFTIAESPIGIGPGRPGIVGMYTTDQNGMIKVSLPAGTYQIINSSVKEVQIGNSFYIYSPANAVIKQLTDDDTVEISFAGIHVPQQMATTDLEGVWNSDDDIEATMTITSSFRTEQNVTLYLNSRTEGFSKFYLDGQFVPLPSFSSCMFTILPSETKTLTFKMVYMGSGGPGPVPGPEPEPNPGSGSEALLMPYASSKSVTLDMILVWENETGEQDSFNGYITLTPPPIPLSSIYVDAPRDVLNETLVDIAYSHEPADADVLVTIETSSHISVENQTNNGKSPGTMSIMFHSTAPPGEMAYYSVPVYFNDGFETHERTLSFVVIIPDDIPGPILPSDQEVKP